jgi:hypothetical protein
VPVPATDAITLHYLLPHPGAGRILLYNAWGAEVSEHREVTFEGEGELVMKLGSIPSGTYLVRLQTNAGESVWQRIVVIR